MLDAGALDSGVPTGVMTHIKTLTASSSGTLSFVNGASSVVFDGTYKEYVFKYIDIHPGTDNVNFTFNLSVDSGSNYNVTKTTNFWEAYHNENDTDTDLSTADGRDLAQSTGNQTLAENLGNGSDESLSGHLTIFNPSSTVFVKHFIAQTQYYQTNNYSESVFVSGYNNVTAAVDGIKFEPSAGTIDSGQILLFGLN